MPTLLDLPSIAHTRVGDAVTELIELQHLENRLQARRMELLAQCEQLATESLRTEDAGAVQTLQMRGMHAEIAAALHLADITVAQHITRAVAVISSYPSVREQCHAGDLSFQQASIISDEGCIINDPLRREQYEHAVVEYALRESAGRLRPVAKKLAAEFTDLDLSEQHTEARARRHVRLHDYENGMAELTAYMPALEAYAIWDRMTQMSWKVKTTETKTTEISKNIEDSNDTEARTGVRNLDEIRTDVFTDLLTAGTPSEELAGKGLGALKGRVQVTVPKRRLLPAEDEPRVGGTAASEEPQPHQGRGTASTSKVAHLTGYGPIDIESTKDLAGHTPTWDEAQIDPTDGTMISVESYQPSQAQRRFLRIRDLHCRFPGCRAPVDRCEVDHTIDAAKGGATTTPNLAHLCKPHHRMKHHTDWSVTQHAGGVLKWVSPLGRTHVDTPASKVIFREADPQVTTRRQKARPKQPSRMSQILKRHNLNGTPPSSRPDGPHPF